MRRVLAVLVAAAALTVDASQAPSAPHAVIFEPRTPAFSPDGRSIAFVGSTEDSPLARGSLFVTSSRGGAVRPLAEGLSFSFSPTWAPDGKRLVFAVGGDNGLYVVNVDGTGLRRIGDGCCPDWGPGGRKIAFERTSEGAPSYIGVVNPDGSGQRLVAVPNSVVEDELSLSFHSPTWSPGGVRLGFAAEDAGAEEAYLAAIDKFGGPVKKLVDADVWRPDWSPDGRRVLFSSGDVSDAVIRSYDLRTRRTRTIHPGYDARWSPDGREIVFVQNTSGPERTALYVMKADGSGVRRLELRAS